MNYFQATGKGGPVKENASTSMREAIRQWEDYTGEKATEAKEVRLIGIYPPIEKTDPSLQNLVNCE